MVLELVWQSEQPGMKTVPCMMSAINVVWKALFGCIQQPQQLQQLQKLLQLTELISSAAPPLKNIVKSLALRREAVMRIFIVTRRTKVNLSFSYRPRLMYR